MTVSGSPHQRTKELPLKGGLVAIVDESDFDALSVYHWCARHAHNDTFYAYRRVTLRSRVGLKPGELRSRSVQLHRHILGLGPGDPDVDHIDRNGLNNTRSNLRVATQVQNQANEGLSTNNTSGYKGVSFEKRWRKWRARIKHARREFYLGLFSTPEEAARAYDAATLRLNGQFARVNFP